MMKNIHCNVEDVTDEEQIREYIRKIVRGEAFDKSGVVYGMGQPVYSLSDPRAVIIKEYVEKLAEEEH